MVGDNLSDGGNATEEEGVRVFRVDVEIDKTVEEHEEAADSGQEIGQSLLSSTEEGLALNR